jgi:hypothetical protein
MFKADIGTLVQAEVARWAEATGSQAEVKVAGRLFGIDITGSLDILGGSLINEGKFHAEKRMDAIMGRAKWSRAPGVRELLDDDYVAQMNMQRLLLNQSREGFYMGTIDPAYPDVIKMQQPDFLEPIKELTISHAGMEDPSWPSERAPLRDESWIGNVRPKGGSFTVRQNAGFVANFKVNFEYDEVIAAQEGKYHTRQEEVKATIRETVPKVGATCWVNKKGESTMCNKYCEMKEICDGIG